MDAPKTISVEYVGLKPRETDCVAGTKITWVGAGSVREVPASAWAIMSKHPDVWKLVNAPPPTGPTLGDAAPVSPADEPVIVDGQANEASKTVIVLEPDELSQMTDQEVMGIGAKRNYDLVALKGAKLRAKFLELQGV